MGQRESPGMVESRRRGWRTQVERQVGEPKQEYSEHLEERPENREAPLKKCGNEKRSELMPASGGARQDVKTGAGNRAGEWRPARPSAVGNFR